MGKDTSKSQSQGFLESDNELDISISLLQLEEPSKESSPDYENLSIKGSKHIVRKRKLRKLVDSNRNSLAKMSQEKREKTCAICLDEVTDQL